VALSARTESDNHGAGEDLQTGRVSKGQRESRDEDRVERRASVAELGCMSEKESVERRADGTEEAREEGQRVRMLRRTGRYGRIVSFREQERLRDEEVVRDIKRSYSEVRCRAVSSENVV